MIRDDSATEIAKPLLAKVCRDGGHDWSEICAKIAACHCQLWLTDGAALVTQATEDNVLECLIAGGTGARHWAKQAEAVLSDFAAENGLKKLRIWGRKGWTRHFPHWSIVDVEDGLLIMERTI
jgi:hypothetical protein